MQKLLVVAALCACGKSKPADTKQDPDDPPHVTNQTLVATKLETVTSKAGAIAFSIDLPIAQLKAPEVKDAYSTWESKQAWFDTPSFTVMFSEMPLQPDSTGDTQPLGDDAKDRVIARAEKLPDGGYLNLDQRNDKKFFKLEVCRPAASGALCCSVIQRTDKPIDAFDQIVGMAEKICKSMKAKS